MQGSRAVSVRRCDPLWARWQRWPQTVHLSPHRCRWLCAPWFIGWWGGLHPLPAPVRPYPEILLPWWAHRRVHLPGATLSLWGCRCPAATRPPPHSLAVHSGVSCHSRGLRPPLSVSHSGGLPSRVFPPVGNPCPFPSSRPMAASRSCCSRIPGGDVGGGAPSGRCTPCFVFCSASLQFTCRRCPRPSRTPHPSLRSWPPTLMPTPPSPLHYTRIFFLHSPPCLY